MSKNYENMSNEEIKEQLEWSDHHEFSYNYAIWAFEEIDRLNNIINELEKYIHNELVLDFYNNDMPCELIINKMEKMIKELKENNNV